MAGLPELYTVEATHGVLPPTPRAELKFRTDQFVGVGLSEAVAEYLEARKATGTMEAPATLDEIYDALISGGFKFGGATDNPSNHKRAMNIALTRNTAQIHKINDNTFALRKWYGMRASRKMAPTSMGGRSDTPIAPQDGDLATCEEQQTSASKPEAGSEML